MAARLAAVAPLHRRAGASLFFDSRDPMLPSNRFGAIVATIRQSALSKGVALSLLLAFAASVRSAPLTLVQEPSGTGHYTCTVNDSFAGTGTANGDDWSFEGEIGDRISVRLEAAVGTSRPRVRLLNTSDSVLYSYDGGNDGVGVIIGYVIATPGTYRVRVYSDSAASAYAMRFDLGRGVNLETESNDTLETANAITPVAGSSQFTFALAGLAHGTDAAGDYFALGHFPATAALSVTAQLPSGGTLTSSDLTLRLFERRAADRSIDVGGSTYATIPHNAVFDAIETANAVTIEAWVYIRSWPQGYFTIFDKYRAVGDWGWIFGIQNGGGGISFWRGNNSRATADVTPSTNTWHHVAVTYDNAANSVRFYLDGALVATRTSPGALTDTDTDPAYIGFSPSGGDEYSDGLIAEIRLWDHALTTTEIQANYAADTISPSATGLVGLWRFDEGTGLVAADATSSGNNATLGGGDPSRAPAWSTGVIRQAQSVSGTTLSRTFAEPTAAWLQLLANSNRGLSAGYFLTGTATDSTSLHVATTSFPAEGGTTNEYLQRFTITFDDELDPAAANTVANYELRNAGADGTFNTADDIVYTLGNPGYVNGLTVSLPLVNGPLQPGAHRLTVGVGLRDRSGNPMAATYTLGFTSQLLNAYIVENQSNDSFGTATSLAPLTADGTGYYGRGRGNISVNGDLDYFSFPATAGDRIIVTTENPAHSGGTGLYYRIYAPDNSEITQFSTYDGTGQIQFVAGATGTYYLRVQYYYEYYGEYRFAVAVFPGAFDLESESNNSAGQADGLTWTRVTGSQSASVAGVITYGDPGDWFGLGFLDAGTQVSLVASQPPSSGTVCLLDILDGSSNVVISAPAGVQTLNYTIPAGKAGTYYARIRSNVGGNLFSQYRLVLTLADTTSPTISGDTLPAEGATVTDFFGQFQLSFSEVLQTATVNNTANYELRAAGADGLFDTADDVLYSVVLTSTYGGGLSAGYRVTDGPLQPGNYRLKVLPALLDIYGNALANAYVRTFTIASVPNYLLESRSNDTFETATSFSPAGEGTAFSGSWHAGVEYATGGGAPMSLAAADFDGDGKLDLVVANYDGGTISVLKGNGNGTFATPATTYAAPNNPFKLAVADLNGDGRPDVVVTRYNGAAIRVFLNDGTGALGTGIDYATPNNPVWLVVADFNGDGKPDVATANYSGSYSVFYNDGSGAFGTPATTSLSGAPYSIATGDLNGDGRLDLAIGTWSDRAVKVMYRQADGTYVAGPVLTWSAPDGIAGVAIGDLNGDGRADLVAVNYGTEARRWHQQADGTLVAAPSFSYGGWVTAYSVVVTDYNGDGNADVLIGRSGYIGVFEGLGAGAFAPGSYPSVDREARQVIVADFNGDGRPDLATTAQQGNAVRVFLGRGAEALVSDGAGGIGRVRGQIAVNGDLDYYSFTAKANDRVFVSSENPNHSGGTGLYYRVYSPDGSEIANFSTYDGTGQTQFVAPTSGTYFVRVQYYYEYYGEYRISVAGFPGTMGLESEGNNSAGQADGVSWTQTAGAQSAAMAGIISYGDPGDWFGMGFLDVGTAVTVTAEKPPSSPLPWILDVINSSSTVVASSAVGAASLTYTVPDTKADTYYVRIRSSTSGDQMSQYRMTFTLADTKPPTITTATVPAEGATVTDFFGDFSLSFSETLRAATVNDTTNYELRSSGADGLFDTADDVHYTVTLWSTYSSGLSAGYHVSDGPLQPGNYRLTVATGLSDLYGNPMAAPYTRTFSIAGVPNYIFESRSNDTFATATSLSPTGEGAAFSGSWRDGVEYSTGGSTTTSVATADLNGDGKLDLVSANYDSGTISVLFGNGDGTFATPATTYPAPNNPFKVAIADLNGDGKPDVVVTRYNGSAVRVFLNQGDGTGTLATGVDYALPSGPTWLVVQDLDGDGKPDIATANYYANSVSVSYNNGNGTFAAPVNIPLSGNPYSIAAGDLNGDGRIDLAVGTWGERSVKVLYRQADGGYVLGNILTWGAPDGIGGVTIGDVNGDGRADLLAVYYGQEARRWDQQPDGSLAAASSFSYGGWTTGYSALVQDYNGDGKPDVLIGRSGYVGVWEGLGGGGFATPAWPIVNREARQVVVADFNGDGRPDLATTAQQGGALTVFLGRGVETMVPDDGGFIGRARGQIATSGDVDYYSFSARSGDRVMLTVENTSHAGGTGMYYRVYRPDQAQVTEFSTYYGTGQTQFIAPISGIYYVRVQYYYEYYGEYRIAVAVLPGGGTLESEDNNSAGQADGLNWTAAAGSLSGSVSGVVTYGDPGDWYYLGSLADAAQISLSASKPPSSGLAWILDVINASSSVVASSAVNATPLTYTVPTGGGGAYYARIRANSGSDLLARYRMAVTITDTQPPSIVGDTLPTEGSTIADLFDRFNLTLSEDMDPTTVNNLANYELRCAGPDATFDTADDTVVPLTMNGSYSSGVTASLRTANGGTLGVGSYRFRAFGGLLDKYGNALASVYTRRFAVAQIGGYTYDVEPNGTLATATPLLVDNSQPDLLGGGARGYLLDDSDVDYWSIPLQSGDRVYIQGYVPGNPGGTALHYEVVNPAGTTLTTLTADYYGTFSIPLFTASMNGNYALRVSAYYGYHGEYRFRVYVLRGNLQVEVEANNSLATATPMTLTTSGNNSSGSIQGTSRTAGDLDYFNLGTLQAGTTVFLSTRQPTDSSFVPVVSLYDAAGNLMAEATGGRASDPVAQVPISITGSYYALVRTSGATSGLESQYILDVLVVPTAGISFPNLQVTSLTPPPATGLKSGDATTLSFRVDNLGNLATPAVTWVDRVVLSTDAVYGNADDLELAVISHAGPLDAGGSYTIASTPVTIPEGIAGNYYVIVRTDHTNTVNEFVLEGDNETITESTIAITRRDYPDLVIEKLAVGSPDAGGSRTASWTLANRGVGAASAGYKVRFVVRNNTTGAIVANTLTDVTADLAAGGTVAQQASFTTNAAGNYLVEVSADPQAQRYEYNAGGHDTAEANNLASASFSIIQMWSIVLSADPVAGGTVSGGGSYAEGTNVTVTAAPNAPYVFVGWFEGAFLRSVNASYTSPLLSDRSLVARFAYPSFVIATQANPLGTGVVSGGGVCTLGTTVSLSANPLPGYLFGNWSEGATNLGNVTPLTFTASGPRTIVANFIEANPTHVVTTATDPAAVATVTGAGTYNNGQSATIAAPATIDAGDTEYVFENFTLNGATLTTSASITKTFTTLDPPMLAYVAHYKSQGLKPVVSQVTTNHGNRVGLGASLVITVRFDRPMDQTIRPLVELVSSNATSVPSVPTNGNWTAPDTYVAPAVAIGASHGGDYQVRVSLAQDTQHRTMNSVQLFDFTIDVTPPPLPTLTAGPVTATSATVDWTGYAAPADLASFRVYRSASSFTMLDGLSPIASLPAAMRSYGVTGLAIDTDYYVAVVPVDTVGNAVTTVTALKVRISSTIPAAVDFTVAALSTNSARIAWTFNPTNEIGFAGFRIYRQSSAFTSLVGLTPIATLTADQRSYDDLGLDRTQTHYYSVVGFNAIGESITTVVSKPWTDPLAGTFSSDFTASDPVLIITQPITITNNATFTVPPGTVVAFGPGAGIAVQSGRLVADGTLFAPIVFTSLADVEHTGPTRGSWQGITLADASHTSVLRNVWIKYGQGLAVTAGAPTIATLGAVWNDAGGLRLSGSVSLTLSAVYLANNTVGASIAGGASLTLSGSVLKNNTVNAAASGTGVFDATGNWWGSADAATIAAGISGLVTTASPLAGEPILTKGLRSADGATSTGTANLPVQLASLNAASYRISENSSFTGVLFVDVPRDPLSPDLFNVSLWQVTFPLSAGGGTKTLYAQFRSPTGDVGPAVSFTTNYVTSGPVITAFSLHEGDTVSRPVNVSATATSALPVTSFVFLVDDTTVATFAASSLATRWDMRALSPGVHRVAVVATDSAGNIASRSLNVAVAPTPPPRPVITSPATGLKTTATTVAVSGTAEPLADLRLLRNGAVVAIIAADAGGGFSLPSVSLVEGTNELVAVAFDANGSTSSVSVFVGSDTGAPSAVTLLPIVYNPGEGVFVDWDLPTSGEVPLLYRVFWSSTAFTSPTQATGQSDQMMTSFTVLKNLPDGQYYFAVVGYDEAGNASAMSNVRSYAVDITPPSFTIAYGQAMPVGPGTLGITVTASEPLKTAPTLLMRPEGGGLLTVTLTPAGGNSYTASFPVTSLSARTGTAGVGVTGTDLAGNTFTGAPSGPALIFDLTKPTGVVNISRPGPIQTTSNVTLGVSLVLSEPVKVGTSPTLSYAPPFGANVPIALTGSGINWSGSLTVTAAMDNGDGTFLLSAEDGVGNVGTVITSGEKLELYNTAIPVPAGVPTNFTILPLKGGHIRLTWSAVDRAQSYNIYREAGASAAAPTTLVASGVTDITFDDLPPSDGTYRYAITSFRLGAESGPSGVRATTSDRTPPPAPTTTTAALGTTGINIDWTAADGEAPAKWVVYRNGTAIRTLDNPLTTHFVDSPPRGVMTYAVAAADPLGNEAQGPSATIELYVGAVANLMALVDSGTGTTLSWASTDSTGVGYNVYRNGAKQNAAPIAALAFTDALPSTGDPIAYRVTAVNASSQESAARVVTVQPLTATVRLNPAPDGDLVSVSKYFDLYSIDIIGGANVSAPIAFSGGDIVRTVEGATIVHATFPLPSTVAAGETKTATVVVPAPDVVALVQGTAITLTADSDTGGSTVAYRFIQDFSGAISPTLMMTVSSDAPPLAGGLTDFTVEVFNRGRAPADLVLSRNGNTAPGDVEMLILNAAGVLVSSTPLQVSVPGIIVNARGDAFVRIAAGASVKIPFAGVLVPENLTGQTVTFRARCKAIYNAVGSTLERTAGPLEGAMQSGLQVTPYYATAATAQSSYSDDQGVVITGTAIDRATGLPLANTVVRIGIRVRGAVLYFEVTTDATGHYSYTYTPSLGLSGELVIWAAHPDVVDQLNQVRVSFYRIFTSPSRVEAVMSKNDKLDFDVSLLNPGDVALGTPSMSFRAYRLESGVEVPVPGLTGSLRTAAPATLEPKSSPKLGLRLQAALDVPDDALFEFTFTTPQGASTKLGGTVSFRPALAVLTIVSPITGYAEAGVARGQLKSVDVTIQNNGLRDMTNAKLVPPANVPWMQVNLAPDASGSIPLQDIPIGGTRTFSIVFAPPADTPVGYYNDFLVIKGDNAPTDYRLNLFATVTSEQKGAVLFSVTNTFGDPVPNTSIWLRNPTLGTDVGPVQTDVNGHVRVDALMEGDWQWKTQAAGHGATQGVVTVVPDQTVGVETELFITMVTVKFSVVPVAFTDYYEIKIEQTFQTRTPIPNLILSPPHQTLNIEAGWSGTLLYTLRNEGLRSVFDVKVYDAALPTMRVTPLVTFIPEIKAQETIEIPVFFEYFGPAPESSGGSSGSALVAMHQPGTPQAMIATPSGPAHAPTAAGALDTINDIYNCYKEFKYGTITFKAEGGISSLSGKPYTVGVNATIDVDELLALVCDGECPERWTGGGIIGAIANKACSKLVGKIIEAVSKKTQVIDIVCKAANIIKAIACAAAQIPSSQIKPGGELGGGGWGGGGGGGIGGGGWSVFGAGCFVPGTPVALADGSVVPIERVGKGMVLRSSAEGGTDTVAETIALSSDQVRELKFRPRDNPNAPAQVLRLTHDHRVWVDGREWVFASEVRPADWLHGIDGTLLEVVANTRLEGRFDVFGLHMKNDNVIFAGGVLTEDQCFKDTPKFSVTPQTGGAQ